MPRPGAHPAIRSRLSDRRSMRMAVNLAARNMAASRPADRSTRKASWNTSSFSGTRLTTRFEITPSAIPSTSGRRVISPRRDETFSTPSFAALTGADQRLGHHVLSTPVTCPADPMARAARKQPNHAPLARSTTVSSSSEDRSRAACHSRARDRSPHLRP